MKKTDIDKIIDNAKAGVGLPATGVLKLIDHYEKITDDLLLQVAAEGTLPGEEPDEMVLEEE